MIEHLFVSKVRAKLLKLFFLNTAEDIHIRGIVRAIDEEINAVRRELKNLEGASLLQSDHRGNRVYYSVNRKCSIFYEILGLIHKEYGLGGAVLRNRVQLGSPTFAVITNAYIEDHHPSQFDIDLLLVGDINLKSTSTTIKEAEEEVKKEIRYTVMTTEDFEFRRKKRDAFVINILEKHKIMLIGDENRLMS